MKKIMKFMTAAKRILVLTFLFALLFSGCAKNKPEEAAVPEATPTPSPQGDALDFSPGKSVSAGDGLIVDEAIAYTFDDTLYGGFTYTNMGSTPLILTEATLDFTLASGSRQETLAPFAGVDDVVLPGETACAALFVSGESSEVVSLSVKLKYEQTEADFRPITVSDGMLIKNYPAFATLSGRILNSGEDEVSLSFVYAMFYDDENKLMGVWFFPKNAVLQSGQGTPFVSHLKSLPIPGLEERAAYIKFRAFGLM